MANQTATFTADEINAAFDTLIAELTEEFGGKHGETERFPIDDVATDVLNILNNGTSIPVGS